MSKEIVYLEVRIQYMHATCSLIGARLNQIELCTITIYLIYGTCLSMQTHGVQSSIKYTELEVHVPPFPISIARLSQIELFTIAID